MIEGTTRVGELETNQDEPELDKEAITSKLPDSKLAEKVDAWIKWAQSRIKDLSNSLHDSQATVIQMSSVGSDLRIRLLEKEKELNNQVEAVKGIEKFLAIRKNTFEVFVPGTKVQFKSNDVEAVVQGAYFDRGGISYDVLYWGHVTGRTVQRVHSSELTHWDKDTLGLPPALFETKDQS